MLVQSLLYLISAFVTLTAVTATPLDDYVWAPDAAYGWKDMVSHPFFCIYLYSIVFIGIFW